MRKDLRDLTIVDDFMFGAVMKDPKKCKSLLEFILKVRIKRIEYPELQKTIDKQYDSKSIRLDVYVEDDEQKVYNVEIQTSRKKHLPKRMRYYQGMIDLNIIDKGEDYFELKKSFVIFICTYDPFGKGKYIYSFKEYCKEENIELGDETEKIIVNAKGTKGDISDELKDVLDYMCGKAPETEYGKELDKAVEAVKESEEWRREYMTLLMRDKEQQKIGKYSEKVAFIRNYNGAFNQDILDGFGINQNIFEKIVFYIENRPEMDDEEIAERIINEE